MAFDFFRIAGMTGTQRGINKRQKIRFAELITEWNPTEFHHGDCIGADAEAHQIVRELLPDCKIFIHPPINESKRAFCEGAYHIHEPKEYLARNKDIVAVSQRIYVLPGENEEQLRSGTWSTWRYARKLSKEIELILPRKK